MKVLSGSAHPQLARAIAQQLQTKLVEREISYFPNGEKRIHLTAKIKNETVFIIQPTIKDEDLIELVLLADAACRKGARKIIAVIPWFGYSPQVKVYRPGESLSALVMAKILAGSGVDKVMIVDPHAEALKKFFALPVHFLSAQELFVSALKRKITSQTVIVTLDAGAKERSSQLARALKLPLVFLKKTPRDRQTGRVEFISLQGQVQGKEALFFDDFVSTGQTLIKAAKFLKKEGAQKTIACVTHYLAVAGLAKKLAASSLDEILVTNSLPINRQRRFKKLKVVSLAPLLAKSIRKVLE